MSRKKCQDGFQSRQAEKQNHDDLISSILEPDGSSKARPGATRLPIVGLDYATFQTWLFTYTAQVIGLGQGLTTPAVR
ncbi:MAG: hypothetical protein JRJ15_03050 [Deltaproteobacteria bacterium]|nr:hypothetical protein [Deltaproteobacteria bacterium]